MTTADTGIILRDHRFVKAVRHGLRDACGVQRGQRLVVAVSGGRDSTALLHALHLFAGQRNWALELHVGHVDHQLRADAAGDAAAVAQLTERMGLAYHQRMVHPGQVAGNLETNAREARYAALREISRAVDADGVVTAHHADDQLETVLMRLIRGAGPGGLAGMRAVGQIAGVRVLRPMLAVDAQTIRAFCKAAGVAWREDVSNADVARWRARLRRDVLPVLKQLRPDASVKAAEATGMLTEWAEVINGMVEAHVKRLCETTATGWTMQRADLAALPGLVRSGVIRHALSVSGVGADRLGRRVCAAIAEAVGDRSGTERCFDLPDGARVRVARDDLRFERGVSGTGGIGG